MSSAPRASNKDRSAVDRNFLLIGLGRIGSSYDQEQGLHPRSHAGAIAATPGLRVSAAVEVSKERASLARKLWGWGDDFPIEDDICCFEGSVFDGIIVATPPEGRIDVIEKAVELAPKLLLIEKPIANSVSFAEATRNILRGAKCVSRVVFQRRFDPLHRLIKSEELPDSVPKLVMARYNRGLLNYGSHLVDLISDWIAPVASVKAIEPGVRYGAGDWNVSFSGLLENGTKLQVTAVTDVEYDCFDIEIYYNELVLRLTNGGCSAEVLSAEKNLFYPGYTHLLPPRNVFEPKPLEGLPAVYACVAKWFQGGGELAGCSVEEAVENMQVLESVLLSRNSL